MPTPSRHRQIDTPAQIQELSMLLTPDLDLPTDVIFR